MYTIAFISILIAIVIIITFIVIQFLKLKLYKDIHNKENVGYIINLSGFMVTLIAVLISIYTIKQADDDRKEQEKKFQVQMDVSETQKSILDSSRRFLDSMNKSFYNLNSSVNKITGKLENIPNQIDNISGSFQSLNAISQKQYSIMFEQYTTAQNQIKEQKETQYKETLKRPFIQILALSCDQAYNPRTLYIKNDGDLTAVVTWLTFEIRNDVTANTMTVNNSTVDRSQINNKIKFKIFNIGEIKEKATNTYAIYWPITNNVTDSLFAEYKLFYTSKNISDTLQGSVLICGQIE